MNSPDVLQRTSHLSERTYADIIRASEKAYATISKEFGLRKAAIHAMGMCLNTSALIELSLQGKGHEAITAPSPSGAIHYYVELPSEFTDDEPVVADPTWQQFLNKGLITPVMPKVLIGTASEVTETAIGYGLPSPRHDLYLPQAC